MGRFGLAAALLAAWCCLAGPAGAEGAEGWAYELSDDLMSPYCPGRALSECPSGAAQDLRHWIIGQENSGARREDVETALFARFGDALLQAPRAEGLGLVAYLVPVALFAVGGLVVLVALSRRRRPGRAARGTLDPALARKLDAELSD